MIWYYLNVTLHVLAALLWLGGMFFLGVVGAPVLRRIEPAELRIQLFQSIGSAFRTVGWAAVVVLLVTGVLNLHFRGMLRGDVLFGSAFWQTRYGISLGIKLVCVGAMLLLSGLHDFVLGPRHSRLPPGTTEARRSRAWASWLARLNAVIGIVLVFAAVRLARGG